MSSSASETRRHSASWPGSASPTASPQVMPTAGRSGRSSAELAPARRGPVRRHRGVAGPEEAELVASPARGHDTRRRELAQGTRDPLSSRSPASWLMRSLTRLRPRTSRKMHHIGCRPHVRPRRNAPDLLPPRRFHSPVSSSWRPASRARSALRTSARRSTVRFQWTNTATNVPTSMSVAWSATHGPCALGGERECPPGDEQQRHRRKGPVRQQRGSCDDDHQGGVGGEQPLPGQRHLQGHEQADQRQPGGGMALQLVHP